MAYRSLAAYHGSTVIFVGELPQAVLDAAGTGEGAGHGTPRAYQAGSQVPGAPVRLETLVPLPSEEGSTGVPEALGRTQTGGPRFFGMLLQDWRLVRHMALPRWPLAHDSLSVWVRRAADGAGSVPASAPIGASKRDSPRAAVLPPSLQHSKHPGYSEQPEQPGQSAHTEQQEGHSKQPEQPEQPGQSTHTEQQEGHTVHLSSEQRMAGGESPSQVGHTGDKPREDGDRNPRGDAQTRALALLHFRQEWEDLLALDVIRRAARHPKGLRGALAQGRHRGGEPREVGGQGRGDSGGDKAGGGGVELCALGTDAGGVLQELLSGPGEEYGGCACFALGLEDSYELGLGPQGSGGARGWRLENCRLLKVRAEALEHAALESFLVRIPWRRLIWVLPLLLS